MVQLKASLVSLALLLASVCASPTTKRSGVYPLSAEEIRAYRPYTYYAAAAYCPQDQIRSWTCGSRFYSFVHSNREPDFLIQQIAMRTATSLLPPWVEMARLLLSVSLQ